MIADILTFLLRYAFFANILFAMVVIFFEKRSVATTWAWLMVVFLLPYIGFILYMAIGFESRKFGTFAAKSRSSESSIREIEKLDIEGLSFMRAPDKDDNVARFKKLLAAENISDLMYLNFVSGGGHLSFKNDLQLLSHGDDKFGSLIQDILEARSFIHIQYYIFRNDNIGKKLVAALAQKAREGVEVRLLIDGMGNLGVNKRRLFKPLLQAGGMLGVFLTPHFFRVNFHNHRKLCIVDGKIGYIGGFNVGDEYLGQVRRYGFWRDMHLRIVGDAVKEMEVHFLLDWNFVCPKSKIVAQDKYFPVIKVDECAIQGAMLQIISSGPDTKWPNIYNGFVKMMSEANKSIYIQTPYFAPDENIFESLKIAALSGIDVRVIIPKNPDHVFVKWCSLSYLGELLRAGVKLYLYNNGFIHSKMIMIDNLVASVGTTNMDMRSFKLNFEINAFIYDYDVCARLRERFYSDLDDCDEVTLEQYNARPVTQKIKEAFSRLLSPLL